jgi:hypothetical protein
MLIRAENTEALPQAATEPTGRRSQRGRACACGSVARGDLAMSPPDKRRYRTSNRISKNIENHVVAPASFPQFPLLPCSSDAARHPEGSAPRITSGVWRIGRTLAQT